MSGTPADTQARTGYQKPLGFGRRWTLLVIDVVDAKISNLWALIAS